MTDRNDKDPAQAAGENGKPDLKGAGEATADGAPEIGRLAAAVREAESAKSRTKPDVVSTRVARAAEKLRTLAPERLRTLAPERLGTLARQHGMKAAALAVAAGMGWIGGAVASRGAGQPPAPVVAASGPLIMDWGMAPSLGIRQQQLEASRLTGEIRALSTKLT